MSLERVAASAASSSAQSSHLEPLRVLPGGVAGRLVVAAALPGPRGQLLGGREDRHVDADLGDDRLGGAPLNAGDLLHSRCRAATPSACAPPGAAVDRTCEGGRLAAPSPCSTRPWASSSSSPPRSPPRRPRRSGSPAPPAARAGPRTGGAARARGGRPAWRAGAFVGGASALHVIAADDVRRGWKWIARRVMRADAKQVKGAWDRAAACGRLPRGRVRRLLRRRPGICCSPSSALPCRTTSSA